MTSDGQLENIMPTSSSQASATASYAWDPLGHMCWSAPSYVSSPSCGSVPQGATTYSYAGDGLRMSETPPGGAVVNFAYDTATGSTPRIIEDSTNAYIYGPGNLPVEQVPLSSLGSSTPTLDIIASDPTGMREIAAFQMTSSGPVLQGYETCSYTTYGTPSSSSSGSSPPSTPVGYENGYTDPTGLVYLINRYYDPSLRQFISVDPAYSTTHQLYGYVGENPVNGSDPSGLLCNGGRDTSCTPGNRVIGFLASCLAPSDPLSSWTNAACDALGLIFALPWQATVVAILVNIIGNTSGGNANPFDCNNCGGGGWRYINNMQRMTCTAQYMPPAFEPGPIPNPGSYEPQ